MPQTCNHWFVEIGEDGSFKGIEERKIFGKDWVAQNLTGSLSGDIAAIEFFDSDVMIKLQVLDTDYENYVITLECFDNQLFALTNEVEPVHMMKINIFSRDSKTDEKLIAEALQSIKEKVPGVEEGDFVRIEHDDTCTYRGFEVNDL